MPHTPEDLQRELTAVKRRLVAAEMERDRSARVLLTERRAHAGAARDFRRTADQVPVLDERPGGFTQPGRLLCPKGVTVIRRSIWNVNFLMHP